LGKEVENTGAVFEIITVNISEYVVNYGRVPIILTLYVPGGLNFDTIIFPVIESTPIKSVS
jgi:hypothetical protein